MGVWWPPPESFDSPFDSIGALWCSRVHYMLALNWYDRQCHIVRAFSTFPQYLFSHSYLSLNTFAKIANCERLHTPGEGLCSIGHSSLFFCCSSVIRQQRLAYPKRSLLSQQKLYVTRIYLWRLSYTSSHFYWSCILCLGESALPPRSLPFGRTICPVSSLIDQFATRFHLLLQNFVATFQTCFTAWLVAVLPQNDWLAGSLPKNDGELRVCVRPCELASIVQLQ